MLAFSQDPQAMATRKSTRHGATTRARRTTAKAGSARGSSSRAPQSRTRTATRAAPRATARASKSRTPRPSRKHARALWAAPLLVVLALSVLGWVFYTPMKIQYQESREQQRLQAELDSLKERNEALSAQVDRLRTPEGVEEVARQTLGMVKQGEHAYVVLDPASEESASPPPTDEPADDTGLWDDALDLIFGVR